MGFNIFIKPAHFYRKDWSAWILPEPAPFSLCRAFPKLPNVYRADRTSKGS